MASPDSIYDQLRGEVMGVLSDRRVRPGDDPETARSIITEVVARHQDRSQIGDTPRLSDPDKMERRLWAALAEWGPLTDLLARDDIEEIFLEGDRVSYMTRGGDIHMHMVGTTEAELLGIVERLLEGTERQLSKTNAIEQARPLGGRARITAVIPPVSKRLSATVRLYTVSHETLDSLVELGSLSEPAAAFLEVLARTRSAVLFAGEPGAGKTTMLSAWLRAVPEDRVIRIVEEVAEINIPLPIHSSAYQATGATVAGERHYTTEDLIKVCLAMRVDLLVVGEVRGREAIELTRAVNTGAGFACTVHAYNARQALDAIVNAALRAGENIALPALERLFASAIDLVVFLEEARTEHGTHRQVREIASVSPGVSENPWTTETLFSRHDGGPLVWTGASPEGETADRWAESLPDGIGVRDVLAGEWKP